MKKFYLLFLLAVSWLAVSCTSDVDGPDSHQSISFTAPHLNHESRAGIIGETFDGFALYGYRRVDDNLVSRTFINQSVTKGDNGWTYSPVQYWMSNSQYRFIGLAASTGAPEDFLTLATANEQQALQNWNTWNLYKATIRPDGENEVVFATAYQNTHDLTQSCPPPVEMVFHHAMSQIILTVTDQTGLETKDRQPNFRYYHTVEGLPQIFSPSQKSFIPSSTNPTSEVVWFDASDTTVPIPFTLSAKDNDTYTQAAPPVYLIPGPANDFTIHVKAFRAEVWDNTANQTVSNLLLKDKVYTLSLPSDNGHPFVFEAGKAYNIRVTLTLSEIQFEVVGLNEWVEDERPLSF